MAAPDFDDDSDSDSESGSGERLHKAMARCGIASKRKCEELIKEGRITIDGRIVREMGVKVDLERQEVKYDGERLRPEPHVYLLAYKPRRVLSASEDRFGRKTTLDMARDSKGRRLFQVGRLDLMAEGLFVLTNDGAFAQDVTHPRRRLDRTFFLKVRGSVNFATVAEARAGIWLADGKTPPMEVQLVKQGHEISTIKCRVVEHRRLSKLWAKLGHPVQRMILVRLGPVGTQGLSKGGVRRLTREEVQLLRSGPPAEVRLPDAVRFGRTPEADDDVVDWGTAAESSAAPAAAAPERRPSGPTPGAFGRAAAAKRPGARRNAVQRKQARLREERAPAKRPPAKRAPRRDR